MVERISFARGTVHSPDQFNLQILLSAKKTWLLFVSCVKLLAQEEF